MDLGEPVLELKIYKITGEIRGGKPQSINFLEITEASTVINTAGFHKVKKGSSSHKKTAGPILSHP